MRALIFWIRFFLGLQAIVILTGCSIVSPNRSIVSPLDSDFKSGKWKTKNLSVESPGIRFYQRVLRKSLASRCRWFPSDSRNAQILKQSCGPLRVIPKAMARFINEPEAYKLGYKVMIRGDRVYFENHHQSCSLF